MSERNIRTDLGSPLTDVGKVASEPPFSPPPLATEQRNYLAEFEKVNEPARALLLDAGRYINYLRTVVREMLPHFPTTDPRHVGFSEAAAGSERRGDQSYRDGKSGHYWNCPKCHYMNDAGIRFNRCGGCGEFQRGYADDVPCAHPISETVTTEKRGEWLCRKCGATLHDSPDTRTTE